MLVDGGAKLYACKMSVDMMGLKKEDFVDGVIDVVTASDFMDMTEARSSSSFDRAGICYSANHDEPRSVPATGVLCMSGHTRITLN